jgi:hypothetical protein
MASGSLILPSELLKNKETGEVPTAEEVGGTSEQDLGFTRAAPGRASVMREVAGLGALPSLSRAKQSGFL